VSEKGIPSTQSQWSKLLGKEKCEKVHSPRLASQSSSWSLFGKVQGDIDYMHTTMVLLVKEQCKKNPQTDRKMQNLLL
jgi:hypothetical protein